MDKLYNLTKAASYLGVTRPTLYKWHKQGKIRFISVNGLNKVSEIEIKRIRGGF